MQTIFEIFNCVDGKTQGYRHTEARAVQTVDRCNAISYKGFYADYLPAKDEGFYIVDMRDNVKAGPFPDRADAQRKSDFENMATDVNSFHVVEHRL